MNDGKQSVDVDPVVSGCEGCGACCSQQGSPPGYLWLMSRTPSQQQMWPDPEDVERLAALPADAMRLIRRYKRDLLTGKKTGSGPCIWLNQQTKQCRHYEHRPQICRDMMVQSESCAHWRREHGMRPYEPVLYDLT